MGGGLGIHDYVQNRSRPRPRAFAEVIVLVVQKAKCWLGAGAGRFIVGNAVPMPASRVLANKETASGKATSSRTPP